MVTVGVGAGAGAGAAVNALVRPAERGQADDATPVAGESKPGDIQD